MDSDLAVRHDVLALRCGAVFGRFWRFRVGVFYDFKKLAFDAPRENFGAQPRF
uniref:Uncharacterized protein n=1 Tax=Meloidogyne incognita TaxID=6306 RepID=A0A914MYP1_MELIC